VALGAFQIIVNNVPTSNNGMFQNCQTQLTISFSARPPSTYHHHISIHHIDGRADVDHPLSEAFVFAIGFAGEYASLQVGESRCHEELPRHHHGILFGILFVDENTGNSGAFLNVPPGSVQANCFACQGLP
jgi:hypothetical protein